MATGQAPAAVWRAPYRRTLHAFYHIQQHDRFGDLRARGNALHLSSLMALAFHEPKRLNEEHQRLLADAGFFASPEDARSEAMKLADEIRAIDTIGAWEATQ
jgi:hypothetical protein